VDTANLPTSTSGKTTPQVRLHHPNIIAMSKRRKTAPVRIDNPAPGSAPYTSQRRAEEYVGRGMAEWCAMGTIRFVERRVVEKSKRETDFAYDGNARISLSTLISLKHVPVINPMALLTNHTKRTRRTVNA
jgi:hypothetical protein